MYSSSESRCGRSDGSRERSSPGCTIGAENLDAALFQLGHEPLGFGSDLVVVARQRKNVRVVGRDLWWPDDALLVVVRLDDRLHRAADADAVAPSDERLSC